MFSQGRSITIGRIFGIRVAAHPSWFFFLFLSIYFSGEYFSDTLKLTRLENYGLALCAAALFFLSLLLHELGHALTALRCKIGVRGIELWLFGGVAQLRREPEKAKSDLQIAAAGPAVTLLIIVVLSAIGIAIAGSVEQFQSTLFSSSKSLPPELALLELIVSANLIILLFNLIPAFPLDGGRILRATIWLFGVSRNRATAVTSYIGEGFGYLMVGFGTYILFTTGYVLNGVWFAAIGWFISQSARAARSFSRQSQQFETLKAINAIDPYAPAIPTKTPLFTAFHTYCEHYGYKTFAVVDPATNKVRGVVRRKEIIRAMNYGAKDTPVDRLMEPTLHGWCVAPDIPIERILDEEWITHRGVAVVIDIDLTFHGSITPESVSRLLVAAKKAAEKTENDTQR